MRKLMKFLKGKKSTILTILALGITYCLTKGWIGDAESLLFNGILVVLGLTANVTDYKMGINTQK